MITEDEAFWAGIAVATLMLCGGFSMLFLPAFTGHGAVVLALGLMTMALTIQMRAKTSEQIKSMTPVESSVLTPTPSVESSKEIAETHPSPQPSQTEIKTEKPVGETEKEPVEEVKPAEPEPTKPIEPPKSEPEQPPQPQVPVEDKTEPPKGEKPKEEPPIVAAAN